MPRLPAHAEPAHACMKHRRFHETEQEEDLRSSSTKVVVRDSCSKQLDSDRLAADVPQLNL